MATDRKIIIIATLAAALLLLTGSLWLTRVQGGDQFADCRQSSVGGGMDSFGTSFTLTNQFGERVTDRQLFQKPSLLYFGYTFCPDVCPLDNARNAAALDLLAEEGKDAQMVFITVDPRRDTPEVMADFAEVISDRMIGLTGTEDEIAAVNRGWRNYYKAQDLSLIHI